MDIVDMMCSICYEQYDNTDRKPHIWSCGNHTCSSCIKSLNKLFETDRCPFCMNFTKLGNDKATNISLNMLSISTQLKNLVCYHLNLNNYLSLPLEFKKICAEHGKLCNLFDLQQRRPICISCFKSNKNKRVFVGVKSQKELIDLKIRDLEDMKPFLTVGLEDKIKDFKAIFNKNKLDGITKDLNNNLTERLATVKNQFNNLTKTLNTIYNNTVASIKANYDNMQQFILKGQRYVALYEDAVKKQMSDINSLNKKLSASCPDLKIPVHLSRSEFHCLKTVFTTSLSKPEINKNALKSKMLVDEFIDQIIAAVNSRQSKMIRSLKKSHLYNEESINKYVTLLTEIAGPGVKPNPKRLTTAPNVKSRF